MFPGYYRPTENEFIDLWDNCTFILDANVLLNLYRYSIDTSSELIAILEKVSDRLWIPYQVAYEYQEDRLSVIYKQIDAYGEIKTIIEDNKNKLTSKLNNYLKHPLINTDNIIEQLNSFSSLITKEIEEREGQHPNLTGEDTLRERVTSLFQNRVGQKYDDNRMKEIFSEGLKRYERNIPPGYMDAKTKQGDEKFGDLILWYQIIDKAKESNKPVIFVTDDTKEDWWWKFNRITIGPKPELIQEIRSLAGIPFYMYRSDQFMEYARQYLQEHVGQEAIDEIREIRNKDDEVKIKINIIESELKSISKSIKKYKNEYKLYKSDLNDITVQISNYMDRYNNEKSFNEQDLISDKILSLSIEEDNLKNKLVSLQKEINVLNQKELELLLDSMTLGDEGIKLT